MCGISALFSWKEPLQAKLIKEMNDLIVHRGPDDEGYIIYNPAAEPYCPGKKFIAALGHRRLSILDLSTHGHQPMCSDDQRYWITYNGEVYNYLEIKKELIKEGISFNSHTDTEVILKCYEKYGVDCLKRFNGMFAFVIYDCQEKRIFVARDRFSVKPLYYWRSPSGFVAFASEIKQLTVLPGWKAELNGQQAYNFLYWSVTDQSEETLFKEVYQIKGGHFIECGIEQLSGKITPRKWYTLPIEKTRLNFDQASEKFREIFEDAVRLRLRADVEVGSCLSGGLDSSSIVCIMNELLKNSEPTCRQLSFSACSHHKKFNESHYIEKVVQNTGIQSHYTYPDLDALFSQLDQILWHQDEPFGSTSIFAQWEVFKLAKEHKIKVMLDGQGADEQLAGYRAFFRTYLLDLLKKGNFISFYKEASAFRRRHHYNTSFLELAKLAVPYRIKKIVKKNAQPRSWLDYERLGVQELIPGKKSYPGKGSFEQLSYAQMTETNLPMLLHYEDRNSMAHSIESRTPFIDYRLVEFIQSLPANYKINDGITKRILREGLKGTLPEEVRTRMDKLGFATPEEVWICQERPQFFKDAVRNAHKECDGLFNDLAIQIADDMIEGKIPFNFYVWRLIIFGKWMKKYNVSLPS